MKHRALILTDPFGPPAYNPRLRTLCDYLAANGWDIEVYTESCPLDFRHDYPIHLIPVYRTTSQLEWICKSVWSLLFDWRNRFFSRQVRKATQDKTYDLVFCCTFSTFPLRAALDIARERHIPLHVDLRDIDEQVPGAQYQSHRQWWLRPFRNWYRNTNIRRRNSVLRHADAITVVSPWHQDFISHINSNVSLVYNGFDSDMFFPQDKPAQTFTIAYVGRLYEQRMQNPALLFEALQTLDIPLKVHWFTNAAGQKRLRHLAKQYGVKSFMVYSDYVPLNQVPDILHNASILLVLSNNARESGAHGIMTTKFYEALGVEKPVLCVRSDEECLAQVIRDTNAGLAATDKDEVKAFILDKYREWQTNGFTRQPVRNTSVFTRRYQAQQFASLLSSLCGERSGHFTMVDICWTLFSSNTTFDFLAFAAGYRPAVPRRLNLFIYKIFGLDIARMRGIRLLKGYTREQLLELAEQFYRQYLLPRRIEPVWQQCLSNDIILVSGTLDIIAETVAKHLNARHFYATQLEFRDNICTGRFHDFLLTKKTILPKYPDFEIVTDNLTDIDLIRHAKKATIITYNNRNRWQRILPEGLNVTFIDAEQSRY